MARAAQERQQRLAKARPNAIALLGRLLLDAEPLPGDARRLRAAAASARQADAEAWEVLADHYKFKLPDSLAAVDAPTPLRKRRIATPADPDSAPAASDAATPANAPSSGELFS